MSIPHFPSEARMSWSGIILVIVGVVLLANNFELLPLGWLRQWWPALLIAVGVMSIVRPQRGRRRSSDADAIDRPRRDVDPLP
ncbi:MAG TPA: DUF5668 domain-containing protein [Caldimonas sp.]|jgi:hypothetical protein|nr:DUF5668 domain-containing protein [Caldimonas sp.]